MTSKNSFFKLLAKNLSGRMWSIAFSILMFFLLFPVAAAMIVSVQLSVSEYETDPAAAYARGKMALLESFTSWAGPENGVLTFCIVCLAVILAINAFSYLFTAKKTDFYHSLPISRMKLYCIANTASFLIAAVPSLIFSLAAAGIAAAYSGYPGCFKAALSGFAVRMAWFLLIYMTTVIAVMMTGHPAVALLGTCVFFFWGPCVTLLGFALADESFATFYQNEDFLVSLISKTSPLSWICVPVENLALHAAIAFILALILALLGAFLYRIRRSEAAGHAMAFRPTEVPIKALLMISVTVCGAFVFREIRDSLSWCVFGGLFALIVSGCVIEIIYRFDFKKLFARKWLFVLCGVISFGILAMFRFAAPLYDNYIPRDSELSSAGIHLYDLENIWNYSTELDWDGETLSTDRRPELDVVKDMKITDKELIRALAENGVKNVRRSFNPDTDTYIDSTSALVVYHLNSGRDVIRRYTIWLEDEDSVKAEEALYASPEYKEAVYPVLRTSPEEYAGINYQDIDGYHRLYPADEAAKNRVITAYREDLLSLTDSTRKQESALGGIQFKPRAFQEAAEWSRKHDNRYLGTLNEWQYYPVYPSFKKTMAALEECGVVLNKNLTEEHIPSITVSYYDKNGETRELVVNDKAEIREILGSSALVLDYYYTSRHETEPSFGIEVRYRSEGTDAENSPDETFPEEEVNPEDTLYPQDTKVPAIYETETAESRGGWIRLEFRKGQVPEFVKKYFGI